LNPGVDQPAGAIVLEYELVALHDVGAGAGLGAPKWSRNHLENQIMGRQREYDHDQTRSPGACTKLSMDVFSAFAARSSVRSCLLARPSTVYSSSMDLRGMNERSKRDGRTHDRQIDMEIRTRVANSEPTSARDNITASTWTPLAEFVNAMMSGVIELSR